jgi:hypothetical protein
MILYMALEAPPRSAPRIWLYLQFGKGRATSTRKQVQPVGTIHSMALPVLGKRGDRDVRRNPLRVARPDVTLFRACLGAEAA